MSLLEVLAGPHIPRLRLVPINLEPHVFRHECTYLVSPVIPSYLLNILVLLLIVTILIGLHVLLLFIAVY